ncbi:MAG TPA: hypothetical protein VNU94_03635 [Acidobacteriaceae bacterium]|nr:hypothetical protein [Acidobacteriaceae bacterium]
MYRNLWAGITGRCGARTAGIGPEIFHAAYAKNGLSARRGYHGMAAGAQRDSAHYGGHHHRAPMQFT